MDTSSAPLSASGSRILPWLVAVAFFMQMLDGTILNIALPDMARDLGVPPLRMQAAVIVYLLTAALLIPASGWLADRFGTRRVFLFAISLFSAGSLLSALSTSLSMLVVARMVQGVGGALMVPVGRLAVIRAYPRDQLVQVLSFITIPGLLGPLVGPVAGGFLVQYASWHWIFLINIPVGVVGALLAFRHFPDLKNANTAPFDGMGFVLFGLSTMLLSAALEGFGELHLPKVESTLLAVAGLMLMALYWLRSAHQPNPLFSLQLFATRSFTVGIFGNLFSRLGSGAMPFLIPLFLQIALGLDPVTAGLFMMPTALAGIIAKEGINSLIKRFGFRNVLAVNTSAVGLSIMAFALITPQTPHVLLLGLLAIFGSFNSMQFTAMNSLTLIDLPDNEAGSGNSLLSLVMQLAASTGVAMAAALYNGFTGSHPGAHQSPELLLGFHQTFLVTGALVIATALIFAQAPKITNARKPSHPVTPAH